jgi:hypothetical protein
MRRAPFLAFPLLLSLPGSAMAVGIGTTYGYGHEGGTFGYYTSPFLLYPSLDLVLPDLVLQLHPFALLAGITHDDLWIGADAYFAGWSWGAGALDGVVVPGASLDLTPDADFDHFNFAAMGQGRVGLEGGDAFRFGVYVVPGLGLGLEHGDFELALGGRVELALWKP